MNMEIWDKVSQPPKTALKVITAGRLKGKSDINPMWRYEAMTEVFGVCGIGWKYTIDKLWREEATDGQVFAFAQVSVQIKRDKDELQDKCEEGCLTPYGYWSEPIQGIGGSMLVTKESSGLHSSDEGYKMAVTDALGTAMKMLGVAADIYAGKWDGSKYIDAPIIKETHLDGYRGEQENDVPNFQSIQTQAPEEKTGLSPIRASQTANVGVISEAQGKRLFAISHSSGIETERLKLFLMEFYGFQHSNEITKKTYNEIIDIISDKEKFSEIMKNFHKE